MRIARFYEQGLVALIVCSCASMETPRPERARHDLPVGARFASTASEDNGATSTVTASATVSEGNGATSTVTASATSSVERSRSTLDTAFFLSNIAVSRDASLSRDTLRFRVRASNGSFGELTRRGLAGKVRDGKLDVRLPEEYVATSDSVTKELYKCSFVIDCDVEGMSTVGVNEISEKPSVDELVRFTSSYISKKNMSRGFDIASLVAKSREGDCSEHAVFLTALARRYGYASRVVLGFAVITFQDRLPLVVGHAWSEVYDGTGWRLSDAALTQGAFDKLSGFRRLSYLPVQILRREDPGFHVEVLSVIGVSQIESAESNF